MNNKQLYNLVFENFVQAKRELFREGYTKKHLEEVDFNDIFEQTKKKMLEEKVKKLQKENEMLKGKLAKKELTKENLMGSMGSTGGYETGGAGSEGLWNFITKLGAMAGSMTAKADIATKRLIKSGKLDSFDSDRFSMNLMTNLEKDMDFKQAVLSALRKVGARNNVMAESRKRRRY
jgi:hypothetical protein